MTFQDIFKFNKIETSYALRHHPLPVPQVANVYVEVII